MIKLHITKINSSVIIPEKEFDLLIKEAQKNKEIAIETSDEFSDLLVASSSGLEFWKNDIDDKIWNNA
jgi:hypothetical protein